MRKDALHPFGPPHNKEIIISSPNPESASKMIPAIYRRSDFTFSAITNKQSLNPCLSNAYCTSLKDVKSSSGQMSVSLPANMVNADIISKKSCPKRHLCVRCNPVFSKRIDIDASVNICKCSGGRICRTMASGCKIHERELSDG